MYSPVPIFHILLLLRDFVANFAVVNPGKQTCNKKNCRRLFGINEIETNDKCFDTNDNKSLNWAIIPWVLSLHLHISLVK